MPRLFRKDAHGSILTCDSYAHAVDDTTNCPPTVQQHIMQNPAAALQPRFLCCLLGPSLHWHDDWQVLVVVWSQLRPRPDHFPLDTTNSPSCLSLKGWWWWWGPAEQATLCQTPPDLGPDQMPSFSLLQTGLWRSLAWFLESTCTNPEEDHFQQLKVQ